MLGVLTWNLFHGRSQPPSGRDLLDDFSATLASWAWDVALLQEVPPWWPSALARATSATPWTVLTSRNGLLALRRALATRWPDVIKSNGGGANAILLRTGGGVEQRTQRLCRLPERRWLQAVRLADGAWVGNLHASGGDRRAQPDCRLAANTLRLWSGGYPVVLGGDFNVRELELHGFDRVAGNVVDYLFTAGFERRGAPEVLDHGGLSDHAPVRAWLARSSER